LFLELASNNKWVSEEIIKFNAHVSVLRQREAP